MASFLTGSYAVLGWNVLDTLAVHGEIWRKHGSVSTPLEINAASPSNLSFLIYLSSGFISHRHYAHEGLCRKVRQPRTSCSETMSFARCVLPVCPRGLQRRCEACLEDPHAEHEVGSMLRAIFCLWREL